MKIINRIAVVDTVVQFVAFSLAVFAGGAIYFCILAALYSSMLAAATVNKKAIDIVYARQLAVLGETKMFQIKLMSALFMPVLALGFYAVAAGIAWFGFGLTLEQICVGLIVFGGFISQVTMKKMTAMTEGVQA